MICISFNSSIFVNISWSNQDGYRAYRYIRILEGINQIFNNVVQVKTEEELGNTCLSVAIELTDSQYGFIGEVGVDGRLHDIAISDIGWEKCLMYDKEGPRRPPCCFILHDLYGYVIESKKSYFTNETQSNPFSIGVPAGHPPLSSFLGVPLIEDEKAIGIIVVANREGGYSNDQLEDLEAIAPAVIQAIKRNKAEKALHDAYEQIQSQSDELLLQSMELQVQNERLQSKNKKLQVQKEELQAQSEEIQIQNEELQIQSEVIHAQNEEFQARSKKLTIANEEFRENEERYGMLFTNIKEGFVLLEVIYNEDGKPHDYRYLEMNPAYELNTGIKREKALGKPIKEAFPNINPMVIKKLEEVALSGQSTNFEMFSQVVNGYFDIFIFIPQKGMIASIFRDVSDRRQLEESIFAKEAELELITDNTPVILNRLSRDLKFVFVNRACAKMFGRTREDIIGKSIVEILGEEAFETIRPYVEKVLQGQRVEYETVIPYKGISPRFMQVGYIPERNEQGEVEGWLATISDITERKLAEEALHESEDRFNTMANAIPQLAWIAQPDGSTTWYNDRWYAYTGTTPEQMEGWGWQSVHDPTVLAKVLEQWKASIATGQPFDIEFPLRGADGIYRMFLTRAYPLKDEKGQVLQWFGTNTDITERKRAEDALKQQASMIDLSPDGIISRQLDGTISFWSKGAQSLYGWTSQEAIGQITHTLLKAQFLQPLEQINKQIQQVGHWSGELIHCTKDGRKVIVESRWQTEFDDQGNMKDILESNVDITKRKDTEAKLKYTLDNLEEKVIERTVELEKAYYDLKESEERLAEAQKIAHIGNWNWNFVTNKVYRSDEIYRIFGCESQEFDGSYGDLLKYVHPDDRDYVENVMKDTLNGKLYSIDYRIILPDGEERIAHAHGELIFDENNTPVRMRGTIQDITERKRLEEALEFLARLPQENPNPVIRLSKGLIINYANPAAQVLLTYWSSTIGQEAPVEITDIAIASLDDGVHRQLECNYNGHTYFLNIAPYPQSGYVNIYARDITERKIAEEALAIIENARKKEIHHRIKNNLQVISSLLDLQADKFNNKENIKYSEVLEAFKESQDRVLSMALIHEELHKDGENDTLNFSHYIEELVDNLFLTYRLGNVGTKFTKDIEDDILFEMDIAVPLGIITNEIISNSLKYAFIGRDEGEIQIKLHRESMVECKFTEYVLSVSDNGVGIPEDLDVEDINSLVPRQSSSVG